MASLFPTTTNIQLAEQFGVTKSTVVRLAKRHGWKKDPVYMREVRTRIAEYGKKYEKGHDPWNKGLTGITKNYPSEVPHRRSPLGSERQKEGVTYVKVEDGVGYRGWKRKHRVIWEEAHGEIPPGYLLFFKDGNPQNCVLDNLELVSPAENARNNNLHTLYPKELCSVILTLGYLKSKIKEKENVSDE